jgi:hypothetical protein
MKYLKHVGVLGMKWGVRKRGPAHSDHSKTREIRTKHLSELSNEEIRTAVTRMHLERQFKDLSFDTMSRGQKAVQSLLTRFGGMAINSYVKQKAGANYAAYQAFADAVKPKGG